MPQGPGMPRGLDDSLIILPWNDVDALREFSRAALAGYKVPKHVLFVDEVPRSPAGKADYPWGKRTARSLLGLDAT